jgi:hypothetical protein
VRISRTLGFDLLAAAVIAGFVLLVTAGLAIAGLVGLVIALACGVSLAWQWRVGRRRRRRGGSAGVRQRSSN